MSDYFQALGSLFLSLMIVIMPARLLAVRVMTSISDRDDQVLQSRPFPILYTVYTNNEFIKSFDYATTRQNSMNKTSLTKQITFVVAVPFLGP